MQFKKLFLFIFACSFILGSNAQQPQYLFQRLGVKDGLFEETVHAVQQDAKGFLWLNFRTLIQRYDGHRLLSFYPGKELPEGNIRTMVRDSQNRLWLLSGDATLGYLNPETFTYQPVKVNIPKGFNHIVTGVYLNKNDEIMLLWDKQGFVTYSNKTGIADVKNNLFTLPEGWAPLHIQEDKESNFWIGTNNGLLKYNAVQKTFSYRGHNVDNDPVIAAFEQIKSINVAYLDKSKNFWIVTWEGGLKVLSINTVTNKQSDWTPKINAAIQKYYVPYGFAETTGGELWLTGVGLFCKVNAENQTVQSLSQLSEAEYGILYDIVFSVYEDREANIWAGTNKGLFRFNPKGQLFKILPNRRYNNNDALETEITDFLETKDGELLVSTWGAGIFSYNKQLKPVSSANLFEQKRTEGTMAWSMIQRPNGDIWCGTQGRGIFIFEAAAKKFIQQPVALSEGKTIRQLAQDKDGNIWLGTHGGAVIKWDSALKVFSKIMQVEAIISRIYVDTHNQIWVGTDRDGLYCLNGSNGKMLRHYTSSAPKNQRLMINGVADILQYSDSIFYIAGNGLSLLNVRNGTFRYFTVADGLPSANISNLLKDGNGFIWMTSGSGIISYNPVKQRINHYNSEDGVPNYNFNMGAASVLKNGTMIFGTNKDFVVFSPGELSNIKQPPPTVHISEFGIMGKGISVDSLIQFGSAELDHDQNAFKVQLATLKFKDINPVYYMLEGIDKTWKRADKTNVVEYNYLPPGNYVFKATCLHEDGKPGPITSIRISIAAPFYKQWWFFSLMALGIAGLVILFDRERTKRREAMLKIRGNIANRLHEEVNTALSNINILSEMAAMKADTEPQKSKEFLEQITSRSNNMINAMDDMLWSIAPENDSMQKAVDRMQEFIEALNNRHSIFIEMLVDEKINTLKPDMQLRHEAFLLFKESIKGLVDSGVTHCNIYIGADKTHFLYTIQFNTENCDMQQLNNLLYRLDVTKKVTTIHATLRTEFHKSNSLLELKIPVR